MAAAGASFCSAAVVVQPQLQPATAGEGGAAGASAAAGTAAASAADAKKAGPGAAKGAKGQEASKAAAPSKARPGMTVDLALHTFRGLPQPMYHTSGEANAQHSSGGEPR